MQHGHLLWHRYQWAALDEVVAGDGGSLSEFEADAASAWDGPADTDTDAGTAADAAAEGTTDELGPADGCADTPLDVEAPTALTVKGDASADGGTVGNGDDDDGAGPLLNCIICLSQQHPLHQLH